MDDAIGGSGGIAIPVVQDGNGNTLGIFNTIVGSAVTVYKSGYIAGINAANGKFQPGQIYWTGANCTGTPYLNDGGSTGYEMYTKTVIYSVQSNKLYRLAGAGAGSVSSSTGSHATLTIENYGADGQSSCSANVGTVSGWGLTEINAATDLGWTVSGTPLQITAVPLQLP